MLVRRSLILVLSGSDIDDDRVSYDAGGAVCDKFMTVRMVMVIFWRGTGL